MINLALGVGTLALVAVPGWGVAQELWKRHKVRAELDADMKRLDRFLAPGGGRAPAGR